MTRTYRREHSHACGNRACHKFWLDCLDKKSWFRYIRKWDNMKINNIMEAEGL